MDSEPVASRRDELRSRLARSLGRAPRLFPWVLLGLAWFTWSTEAEAQFSARGRRKPEGARPSASERKPSAKQDPPPAKPTTVPDAAVPSGVDKSSATESPSESRTSKEKCEDWAQSPSVEEAERACARALQVARTPFERAALYLEKSKLSLSNHQPEQAESELLLAEKFSKESGLHRAVLESLVELAKQRGSLDAFLRKHAESFRLPEERLYLAKVELSLGRVDAALKTLRAARERGAETPEIVLLEAETLYSSERSDEAQRLLLSHLRRSPSDDELWFLLLRKAGERGQLAAVLPDAERFVASVSDTEILSGFLSVAEELADANFLELVLRRLNVLSERDEAALFLRLERELAHDASEAERLVQKFEKTHFRSANSRIKLGTLFLNHGVSEIGLNWLRLGARPPSLEGERQLALGLERASLLVERRRLNYLSEAEELWRKLAFAELKASSAARAEARRHLLGLKQSLRKLSDEIALASRELGKSTVTSDHYLYASELWTAAVEPKQSLRVLEEGIARFPLDAALHEAKLTLEERNQNYDGAIQSLRELQKLVPEKEPQYSAKLIELLEAKGAWAVAIAQATLRLEARPDDLKALLVLARLLEKVGDRRRALELYRGAIEKRGPSPDLVIRALKTSETHEDAEAATKWLLVALRNVQRSEEAAPLLAVVLETTFLSELEKSRVFLNLLSRFPEDRLLRAQGIEFFERQSLRSLHADQASELFSSAHPWLLSVLAQNDRGHERRTVLSILERYPPRDQAGPLFAFLRKSSDLSLELSTLRVLEHQTSLDESQLFEIAFHERTPLSVTHGVLALLVGRGRPVEPKWFARTKSFAESRVRSYGYLLAQQSRAASAAQLQGVSEPEPLAGAILGLCSENSAQLGSKNDELTRAMGAFLRVHAALASPSRERDVELFAELAGDSTVARSAVLLALSGTTPEEFRSWFRAEVHRAPSNLEALLLSLFQRGDERSLSPGLVRSHAEEMFEALRGVALAGPPGPSRVVDALALLKKGAPELSGAFGWRLGAELFARLESDEERAVTLVGLLPLGDAEDAEKSAILERVLERGGAPAVLLRERLAERSDSWGVTLVLRIIDGRRPWFETRRDLELLGKLLSVSSPSEQEKIQAFARAALASESPLVVAEAESLLRRSSSR